MERIILAFSTDATALKIKAMLDGAGYKIDNVICGTAPELFRTVADYDDVLVIMGYKLPDMVADMVREHLHDGCKLMSIVKAEHADEIESDGIFVLPLPINRRKLLTSIEVMCGETPRQRTSVRSPEEAKTIEKAKLYLMEHYHMTEERAHRFMQKRSMDTGSKMIDTARLVLNL